MPHSIYRGDSWVVSWTILGADNQPINLTGASARVQLRDSKNTLMVEASTGNGLITITPTQGRIDMNVPYSAMEAIPVGTYQYDLEVTFANGVRRTYVVDQLYIERDVSY
jgi:hypothetical protein